MPTPNTCTLVTCYYRFPSKHSYEQYDTWMKNLLTTVDAPMVIFCEEEWVKKLAALRKGFEEKTVIVALPWEEMLCVSGRCVEYWNRDWKRDPEQGLHNQRLYILWNEKTAMVRRAMEINPFDTEFYCWCDVGCFRAQEGLERYARWPAAAFLEGAKRDRMYLLNIEPFEPGELDVAQETGLTRPFVGKNRIGGTIFLAHVDVWPRWFEAYYGTLERYMQHDYFAGKDQNVMATMVALHPDLVELIAPSRKEEDGDPWFYLQRYFAGPM